MVRLYAVVVMVVLAAPAIAEDLIAAGLPTLDRSAPRNRRGMGNDAPAILASVQLSAGCYQPVELEPHRSQEIPCSPTTRQLIGGKQGQLALAAVPVRNHRVAVRGQGAGSVLDHLPQGPADQPIKPTVVLGLCLRLRALPRFAIVLSVRRQDILQDLLQLGPEPAGGGFVQE